MSYLRANGLDVHYTTEGVGPPLLMLHGATSTAVEDWAAQRPLFRQSFTLYLLDARGHGGTRWDVDQGWDREMLVADLEAVADALGLETFHAAGFSMGAMTVLLYATRHPERLRTAIVAGIDILREPRSSVSRRLMDPERIERDEPAWAADLERRHGPVQGPGAWQKLLRAISADIAGQDLLSPEELRKARLPILLAYGDRDVFVPADHAVALHRQLPDSRLLIVPNSGHVVIVNQPQLFNDAATAFWRQTGAEAEAARSRARTPSGGAPGDGAVILNPRRQVESV